ncbi:MAG: Uma2 family endonuclease [Bacteroidota bacterium]
MTTVTKKFPTTHAELIELAGNDLIRFPATYDEYWNLLAESEFRVDFYQNEIITMSYENDTHADLVMEFGYILKLIFPKKDRKFTVYDPNRPVYVADCKGHAVFNPDGSVTPRPASLHEYSKGMNASTNPILLFEVLSPSTSAYDFGTKLPCYKQIQTLQTIIYLETFEPKVIVMERLSPNQWRETEYTKETDVFTINEQPIYLKDIYLDIHF